jgi:hypothetical protein
MCGQRPTENVWPEANRKCNLVAEVPLYHARLLAGDCKKSLLLQGQRSSKVTCAFTCVLKYFSPSSTLAWLGPTVGLVLAIGPPQGGAWP